MSKNSTFDFLAKNGGKIVTFGANFAPSFIMYVSYSVAQNTDMKNLLEL